jgi:hypothetical protein
MNTGLPARFSFVPTKEPIKRHARRTASDRCRDRNDGSACAVPSCCVREQSALRHHRPIRNENSPKTGGTVPLPCLCIAAPIGDLPGIGARTGQSPWVRRESLATHSKLPVA